MPHTINDRSEIPDAPFYVLSNDRFMSGWGPARNQVNTIILPCATSEQADTVLQNCQDRPEQKNVRLVIHKPRMRDSVLYSLLTETGEHSAPLWYSKDRPFQHHRRKD